MISSVWLLGPSSNVRATYFSSFLLGNTDAHFTSAFTGSSTTPLSTTLPVLDPVQTSDRPALPHVSTYRTGPVPSTVNVGSIVVAATSWSS